MAAELQTPVVVGDCVVTAYHARPTNERHLLRTAIIEECSEQK